MEKSPCRKTPRMTRGVSLVLVKFSLQTHLLHMGCNHDISSTASAIPYSQSTCSIWVATHLDAIRQMMIHSQSTCSIWVATNSGTLYDSWRSLAVHLLHMGCNTQRRFFTWSINARSPPAPYGLQRRLVSDGGCGARLAVHLLHMGCNAATRHAACGCRHSQSTCSIWVATHLSAKSR